MRKLTECITKANGALRELEKEAKKVHELLENFQPESDLVKQEKIVYTGSLKDFVRWVHPIYLDPNFRVNGKQNREAMTRVLHEMFEIRPNNCPEPRSFRSLLSLIQEECEKDLE